MAQVPDTKAHHEHTIEHHDLVSPSDAVLGAPGDKDHASSLKSSIHSIIHGHDYHHGRRYHGHRQGSYLLPNDAEEADRLDMQHHVYKFQLDGALVKAPIGADVERVLDIGCGTGRWAIEFAGENPKTEVLGFDLTPMHPGNVPKNCTLYVDDAEGKWHGPDKKYDYIHARGMTISIADWPGLYQHIQQSLKPGGWIELQDFDAWIYSDDDPELEKAPYTKQWRELADEASKKHGKQMNRAAFQKQWMIDAGFENVKEVVFKVPIGGWAKDPALKEIGKQERKHMIACVESYTLAPLTRQLGWAAEDVHTLTANIRSELGDTDLHMITIYRYIYGQKKA